MARNKNKLSTKEKLHRGAAIAALGAAACGLAGCNAEGAPNTPDETKPEATQTQTLEPTPSHTPEVMSTQDAYEGLSFEGIQAIASAAPEETQYMTDDEIADIYRIKPEHYSNLTGYVNMVIAMSERGINGGLTLDEFTKGNPSRSSSGAVVLDRDAYKRYVTNRYENAVADGVYGIKNGTGWGLSHRAGADRAGMAYSLNQYSEPGQAKYAPEYKMKLGLDGEPYATRNPDGTRNISFTMTYKDNLDKDFEQKLSQAGYRAKGQEGSLDVTLKGVDDKMNYVTVEKADFK